MQQETQKVSEHDQEMHNHIRQTNPWNDQEDQKNTSDTKFRTNKSTN